MEGVGLLHAQLRTVWLVLENYSLCFQRYFTSQTCGCKNECKEILSTLKKFHANSLTILKLLKSFAQGGGRLSQGVQYPFFPFSTCKEWRKRMSRKISGLDKWYFVQKVQNIQYNKNLHVLRSWNHKSIFIESSKWSFYLENVSFHGYKNKILHWSNLPINFSAGINQTMLFTEAMKWYLLD